MRQVLETLVFRLRRQLADKESKQKDMKNAIESLRSEMLKAAEGQAVQQAAAMQALAGPSSGETDAQVLVYTLPLSLLQPTACVRVSSNGPVRPKARQCCRSPTCIVWPAQAEKRLTCGEFRASPLISPPCV